ncbi:hypothetical protein CTAYLR_000712 [Chrysophaeum taylorii]|uniref:Uncharacterized protein n=1 Tax=Chrysophaeum taylorii TaxID=2483200 RepID=A0AAD7XI74_9STRA|nr:hypothetical protein CTAYLR_000712 [Chrysophaeum taylorii]
MRLGAVVVAVAIWRLESAVDQAAKLYASDASSDDSFGFGVAVYNATLVVSAPFADALGEDSGAVYVFDASYNQVAKLTASGANGYFGSSVAIFEDVIVVGAYGVDEFGVAYVFDAFERVAKLNGSDALFFGQSVAIHKGGIVVGAWGAAYIFDAQTYDQIAALSLPYPSEASSFGSSVSIYDDTVVVGAVGENRAYVFNATTGVQLATLEPIQSDAIRDGFGIAVAIYEASIVVGSETVNVVYLFNQTYHQVAQLNASGDGFGSSVAIFDETVVGGAFEDNVDQGSAYVFDAATYDRLAEFHPADRDEGDNFGSALAIYDKTILVGQFGDDDRGTAHRRADDLSLAFPHACTLFEPNDAPVGFPDCGADCLSIRVTFIGAFIVASDDATVGFAERCADNRADRLSIRITFVGAFVAASDDATIRFAERCADNRADCLSIRITFVGAFVAASDDATVRFAERCADNRADCLSIRITFVGTFVAASDDATVRFAERCADNRADCLSIRITFVGAFVAASDDATVRFAERCADNRADRLSIRITFVGAFVAASDDATVRFAERCADNRADCLSIRITFVGACVAASDDATVRFAERCADNRADCLSIRITFVGAFVAASDDATVRFADRCADNRADCLSIRITFVGAFVAASDDATVRFAERCADNRADCLSIRITFVGAFVAASDDATVGFAERCSDNRADSLSIRVTFVGAFVVASDDATVGFAERCADNRADCLSIRITFTFSNATTCNGTLMDFNMYDSYGDGWNGACFTIENVECTYEITVGGGTYDSEISWKLDIWSYQVNADDGPVTFNCQPTAAPTPYYDDFVYYTSAPTPGPTYTPCPQTFSNATTCNGTLMDFKMYDSYGDGWNGACFTINNSACSSCTYEITVGGGTYDSEISWKLDIWSYQYNADDGPVTFNCQPTAAPTPYYDDFVYYTSAPTPGPTYTPCPQTFSNATTCNGTLMDFKMYDSYGDGWNGACFTINNSACSSCTYEITVGGGTYDSEISWKLDIWSYQYNADDGPVTFNCQPTAAPTPYYDDFVYYTSAPTPGPTYTPCPQTFSNATTCNGTLMDFKMYDSYGDGWNGACFTINNSACSSCTYEITVGGGTYDSEISWKLDIWSYQYNADDGPVTFNCQPTAAPTPYYDDFVYYTSAPTPGPTYTPCPQTFSNATTCNGTLMDFKMYDSYGDGWNGACFTINNSACSSCTYEITVGGGTYDSEISWKLDIWSYQYNADDGPVTFNCQPTAAPTPYYDDFVYYTSAPTPGPTYTPCPQTFSNATTCNGTLMDFKMYDSYGDGWNGACFTINNSACSSYILQRDDLQWDLDGL